MPHKSIQKFSAKIGKPLDVAGFKIGRVVLRGLTGQSKKGLISQRRAVKASIKKTTKSRRARGLGPTTGARGFINKLFLGSKL